MTDPVSRFNDGMVGSHHRILRDRDDTQATRSAVFTDLIASRLGGGNKSILDCACGAGTRSIDMAMAGHRVVASDISAAATQRAAREADRRGVLLPTAVADMRALPFSDNGFDVVICSDNALPQLLTEHDMRTALGGLHRSLRSDGLLIATIRDYRHARQTRQSSTAPQISEGAVTFQLWNWHDDGARYDLRLFRLAAVGANDWRVSQRRTSHWAITPDELSALAAETGFTDIEWIEPATSGFYQPILLATA